MNPVFHITESAVTRLLALSSADNRFLRISVLSGGCSGLQYQFDFEKETKPDDMVIHQNGVTVLLDPISYPFLENASLSYEQELIGAYFKITNPNADKSCGCGASFSL